MTEFEFLGSTYRTNADASRVERLAANAWTQTHSLRVILKAREVLAQTGA